MIIWRVISKSAAGTYVTNFSDEDDARKLFDDLCDQQREGQHIEIVALESIRHEQDTRVRDQRPGPHAGEAENGG
jgi:hypothetical protein